MKIKIRNYEFEVEGDYSFWNNINNWEQYSFDILDKLLNINSTFIDIGAWNGVLSMYAAKICRHVYSFEPDRIAYNNLYNNITLNNLTNIICHRKGASNNNGSANLYVRTMGDSVSSLLDRQTKDYTTKETIKVETIKLSTFLLQDEIIPSLIKMDIEGGEIFVIDEMQEYIKQERPKLFISFHPAWFPDKDNDIKIIADIMNSTYNIYNVNFVQYTKEKFIDSLYLTEHAFIFIAK